MSSTPIRVSRPRCRASRSTGHAPPFDPCSSTGRPWPLVATAAGNARAVAVAVSGSVAVTSAGTRSTRGASGERANRAGPSVPDPRPASTPMPRSSSAAATASVPGSCQFTEAMGVPPCSSGAENLGEGSTVQEAMRATRRGGSGSTRTPVVTPTGTSTTARSAASAGPTTRGESESRPHGVLGWTWMSVAPAATACRAASASAAGDIGTAPESAAVRGPLRHTCSIVR